MLPPFVAVGMNIAVGEAASSEARTESQRRALDARFAEVEPAQVGFGAHNECVVHEGAGEVVVARRASTLLQQAEECAAVLRDDLYCVGVRRINREQHLQHEFVTGRRVLGGHERPPRAECLAAISGEFVGFLAGLRAAVGFGVAADAHETVAFESIECLIHLSNVEGPDTTGCGFKVVLELESVARATCQKGQKPFAYCHIPSIYTQ